MICRFDSEDLNRKESLTILCVDMLDLQGYKISDHSWILFDFGLSSHHGSHSLGRRRDICAGLAWVSCGSSGRRGRTAINP